MLRLPSRRAAGAALAAIAESFTSCFGREPTTGEATGLLFVVNGWHMALHRRGKPLLPMAFRQCGDGLVLNSRIVLREELTDQLYPWVLDLVRRVVETHGSGERPSSGLWREMIAMRRMRGCRRASLRNREVRAHFRRILREARKPAAGPILRDDELTAEWNALAGRKEKVA